MIDHDVVIVGAGIVGLATARAVLLTRPDLDLAVVEAEPRVGAHQSSHNSGVVHAGHFYRPGSRKARWCVQGKRTLEAWCVRQAVPVHRVGKVVVATRRTELVRLRQLHRRADANGVEVRWLDPAGLAEVEPHVTGIAALHSPGTATVDFAEVTRALAADVVDRGGTVLLGHTVRGLSTHADRTVAVTDRNDHTGRVVVTCAGLGSDRLMAMAGHDDRRRVAAVRGTWAVLADHVARLVRGNIYPVPDLGAPFLGVHLTPHNGQVWAGPTAVLTLSGQDGDSGLRRILATVADPHLRVLASRHLRTNAVGLWQERVVAVRAQAIARYLPVVRPADLRPGPTGTRAQLVDAEGRLVEDFVMTGTRRLVHVRNAPSPAATACLSIGAAVRDEVLARLD